MVERKEYLKKTHSVERRTSYKSCYGDTALRKTV